MARESFAVFLLMACVGLGLPDGPRQPSAPGVIEAVPDPGRARPLGRWPNDADLARLRSVEGRAKGVILQVLGHPSGVQCWPNGEEVWDYPWCAACRVWIRNGVCTGTFYSAGF